MTEENNIQPTEGHTERPDKEETTSPTPHTPEDAVAKEAEDEHKENTKESQMPSTGHIDVRPLSEYVDAIRSEISKVIVGQNDLVDLMITCMLVRGHCLIEGLPGIAKTLTSRLLAGTISADYSRIQFTPDLMPTDITGTSVFNMKEGNFDFRKGPIFSNVVLIDEINRAPAKTQAALMEVMEERQITYDGVTYVMDNPFFVIATQNPIEQEGTYNLPEAQLDRFLFKIKLGYPSLEDEEQILKRFEQDFGNRHEDEIKAVVSKEAIDECVHIVEKVHIRPELLKYIAAVVHNTRNNGDLYLGASPRASLSIMRASKAFAAINGRDFVTPDDIKTVAHPVLNHRLIMSHEREMDGTPMEDIINSILSTIEIPR